MARIATCQCYTQLGATQQSQVGLLMLPSNGRMPLTQWDGPTQCNTATLRELLLLCSHLMFLLFQELSLFSLLLLEPAHPWQHQTDPAPDTKEASQG